MVRESLSSKLKKISSLISEVEQSRSAKTEKQNAEALAELFEKALPFLSPFLRLIYLSSVGGGGKLTFNLPYQEKGIFLFEENVPSQTRVTSKGEECLIGDELGFATISLPRGRDYQVWLTSSGKLLRVKTIHVYREAGVFGDDETFKSGEAKETKIDSVACVPVFYTVLDRIRNMLCFSAVLFVKENLELAKESELDALMPFFVQFYKEGESNVREATIAVLNMVGGPKAVASLGQALGYSDIDYDNVIEKKQFPPKDENFFIRKIAGEALNSLCRQPKS